MGTIRQQLLCVRQRPGKFGLDQDYPRYSIKHIGDIHLHAADSAPGIGQNDPLASVDPFASINTAAAKVGR